MSSLVSLLVDLVLFGADERAFVDVRMDFDVRVVAELEGILCGCELLCEYAASSFCSVLVLPTCCSRQASCYLYVVIDRGGVP